jgi:hypothetical protein
MDLESDMEWIRRASDYQTLVGKRDHLGCRLHPEDAARLAELERFFAVDDERRQRAEFEEREQARVPLSVLVEFEAPKGGRAGRVRDLSGLGMWVDTDTPLPVGARTVVRVEAAASGEAWRFGAEVVHVRAGTTQSGMGMKFIGIPLTLRVGHRPSPIRTRRAA